MRVLAFDAYVAEERFRALGVERAGPRTRSTPAPTSSRSTCRYARPRLARRDAFPQMMEGVRIINVARGKLVVEEALREALDSGRVAGAASTYSATGP